jgi:hypothetical protein
MLNYVESHVVNHLVKQCGEPCGEPRGESPAAKLEWRPIDQNKSSRGAAAAHSTKRMFPLDLARSVGVLPSSSAAASVSNLPCAVRRVPCAVRRAPCAVCRVQCAVCRACSREEGRPHDDTTV